MASGFEGVLLNSEVDVQRQVREFYDSVGWQEISAGVYQNARYEDLRPVSREYVHHCHMRVNRHLPLEGEYLLDAGSGPIQYPEYLEYSRGYRFRVCLDLSRRALRGARERVGEHGLLSLATSPGCRSGRRSSWERSLSTQFIICRQTSSGAHSKSCTECSSQAVAP